MNKFFLSCLYLVFLILPACESVTNTARRAAQDAAMLDPRGVPHATPSAESLIGSTCPSVEVVTDLGSSMEFVNMRTPTASQMISRLDITNITPTCSYERNSLKLDLNIDFEGRLGPQAIKKGINRFASYPFFVSVLSNNNHILAKEVFSASLTYDDGQSIHPYRERIRHIIPLPDKNMGNKYRILVGFQLTPEQLEYNRTLLNKAFVNNLKDSIR